jgi:hypothetical protein
MCVPSSGFSPKTFDRETKKKAYRGCNTRTHPSVVQTFQQALTCSPSSPALPIRSWGWVRHLNLITNISYRLSRRTRPGRSCGNNHGAIAFVDSSVVESTLDDAPSLARRRCRLRPVGSRRRTVMNQLDAFEGAKALLPARPPEENGVWAPDFQGSLYTLYTAYF